MMKITLCNLFLSSLILVLNFSAFAQKYAQSSGSWSSVTWSSDKAGLIPSPGTPTATDDVYTNGRAITVSTAATCRNLAVTYNVSGGLVFAGSGSLTVTGAMFGWNDSSDSFAGPTVNVFNGSTITVAILFTGANHDGFDGQLFDNEVISNWNSNSPIARVTINTPIATTFSIDNDGANSIAITQLFIQGSTNLKTSFFNFPISPANAGLEISTVFSMASAANIFDCAVPIRGTPTLSSRTATATINGTLITSSYFNASTFNMGASGVLRTSFAGSDQTTGWWYQSASPTAGSINASSTVSFEADVAQNVPARVFGNLFLDAASPVTKTLGSGTLNVNGNLTINSSSITFNTNSATAVSIGGNLSNSTSWAPAISVTFNGLTSQSISGSGTTIFAGGLTINKASGTLTLNQNISVQNGLTITSGTLDLGSNTLSLSGNLSNSGTLIASASTLNITGSSSFSGSVLTLNNLTISGTGSLTAPVTLNIAGNFTNNGTFNANNGTVTFSGSSAQSIAGTATFNNIDCNNAAGVNITGNINLGGVLTLNSSGLFDADGPSNTGVFTVLSTSVNAGGRIAALPIPSNFIGDVTIQRFIHSQTGGDWRYISVPITTGNNLGLVQTAIGVTGNFSDRSTSAQFPNVVDAGNTNPSVFTNTGAGFVAVNGSGGTVASTSLSSRVGYAAYNFNNGPVTASYRGQIEKGNSIPIAISSTNGNYNLVPNPFPSAIDWDNVTKSTVNDAIWLRTANNIFTSYVGGVGSPANEPFVGWTGEIAIGQAFWVQSNGAGSTLTFKEADKTSNSFEFLRQEEPINYFRVKLASATQSDDAVIRFHENGSDYFNPNFDAPKRKNGNYVSSLGANSYLNISTYVLDPGTDYSINTVGMINCSKSIKIKLEDAMLGNYTMTFGDLDKMQLGYSIVLRDNLLNKDVAVNESTSYTFAVTSDPTTYGSNRFVINFTSPQVAPNAPNYTFSNLCESQIQYQLNTQAGINYQITKGGSVLATVIGNGNQVSGFISRSSFNTGNNVFDLQAASQDGCNKVAFPGVLSINLQQTPSVVSVLSTTVCNSGTSTLTAVGAPADGQYRWYFSADAKNSIAGQIGSAFTTPVISETTSFFVATINGQGCEGPSTSVQAVVSKLAKPSISVTGFVLSSSISEGNQWFKNGAKIEGATGSTITVLESGTYSVSVQNAAGCTQTSDNLVMSIAALEDARSLGISIYPNPAAEELKMKIPTPMVEKITSLGVIDIKGSGSVYLDAIQEDVTIPVGHLPSGVYFARIKIGNEFKFLRFIKK